MTRRPRRPPLFPSTPLSRSHSEHPGERELRDRLGLGVEGPIPDDAHAMIEVHARGEGDVDSVGTQLRRHRSEEHTSELQPQSNLVCRLLLEKKKTYKQIHKQ